MKKTIIICLIPIFSFLVPLGIISGGFFLSGCTEDTPDRYVGAPPVTTTGDGSLFSRSRFSYYNQLLGYPNDSDWLRMWSYLSDFGTSAKSQGNLVDDDYKSFVDLFGYFAVTMEEVEVEYKAAVEQDSNTNLAFIEDDAIKVIEMASYTGIGEVLNVLFEQLGRDWLYHHLYPMIAHYYAMPYETFIGMINTIEESDGITKIPTEDFNTLSGILKRMFDDRDETYGPVWEAMPSAWDMIDRVRNYGDEITVGDVKNMLNDLVDLLKEDGIDLEEIADIDTGLDEDLLEALYDAVKRVWNDGELEINYQLKPDTDTVDYNAGDPPWLAAPEIYTFQDVLGRMLCSVGTLTSNEIPDDANNHDLANGWDNTFPMTDLQRVLLALEDFLAEYATNHSDFATFFNGIITASAGMDGANSLSHILRGLAETEPAYLQGLDYSVDLLFKQNKDGVFRDNPTPTPQTSAMRVLLAMLEYIDVYTLFSVLNAGNQLGSSHGGCGTVGCTWLDYEKCTVSGKDKMLDWGVGEISNSMVCCSWPQTLPPTFCGGPFEGWDYVLFQKPYRVNLLLWGAPSSGLLGMLGTLGGAVGLPLYTGSVDVVLGYELLNGQKRTGIKHQMIAPVAPIMQNFWNWCQSSPGGGTILRSLVSVVTGLNEIVVPRDLFWFQPDPPQPRFYNDTYAVRNGLDVTYYPNTGVLKTVEGMDGYGLATYALRRHYDPSTMPADPGDHGILDPVLNMTSMIVNELIDTPYEYDGCNDPCTLHCDENGRTCTLFSALMKYLENNKIFGLDLDEFDDNDTANGRKQVISDLFYPDGEGLVDKTYDNMIEYHEMIDVFARDIGKVLVALTEDVSRWNRIVDDIDTLADIFKKMNISTETDGVSGFSDVLDHFLKENPDGSDNLFMANMKVLLFKILNLVPGTESEILARHGNPSIMDGETDDDVQTRRQYYLDLYKNIDEGAAWWFRERNKTIAMFTDDEYKTLVEDLPDDFGEPSDFVGSYDDTTSLSLLFSELYGSDDDLKDGLYSMSHVRNFIDELGDSDVSMLDIILDPLNETIVEHDPSHTTQTWNSMFSVLKAVMWDNVPARKWTQSMGFTIYDVDLDGETDHTGALLAFRVLNLAIDMNGVLEDSILFWGGPDVRPAGYTWNIWKEIFRFQYNAMWVW